MKRLAIGVLGVALLTAGCGGSGGSDGGGATTTAGEDDGPTATAGDATSAPTSAGGEDDDAGSTTAPSDGDTPSSGEPLRLGIQLEPATMDLTSDPSAGIPQVLLYNVYETLVRQTPDGSVEPGLAESYEISDDGLTYTFTLRSGVTYQGGQDFTAEDVVYSIENVKTKEPAHPFKATFDPIETVTAVDDQTVELTLSRPSANLLFYLTQGQGVILDSEGAGDLASGANGTGPFTFGEWVKGDHITLNKNPDYWGEPAKSDSVEYRYIPDPNALANAMEAGDLDIVPNLSAPELFGQFEDNDAFVVSTGDTYGEIVLSLNGDNAPLSDVRVRQAITYAIDSKAVRDLSYSGYGTLIGTFSTPLDPYFKDDNDVYPYDPEKAKSLLAEAGVSDVTLRLIVPPVSYATRGAEIIQSQLAEVGIKVEITNLDSFGTWIDQVFTNQDYDMSIVAHVEPNDLAKYGDPDYYWGNDSPDIGPIVAEADATLDEAERNKLYQQALDSLAAEAADTWLYVLPLLSIATSRVQGYEPSTLSIPLAGVSVAG